MNNLSKDGKTNQNKISNTKSNTKDKRVSQIVNVGNVILIHEGNTLKMNFKLGIIDKFKPSRDGAKRMANVQYVINSKTVYVPRLINKLYLL